MSPWGRQGGRHPDPGMGVICARCGEPRLAHGGRKKLGACPGQHGLQAHRFQLRAEDKPQPEPEWEWEPRPRLPLPPNMQEIRTAAELDDLRRRLSRARACTVPGAASPVAVSVDGFKLVFGTARWVDHEPDVTPFGQNQTYIRHTPTWEIEAEIRVTPVGLTHELRWGDVDSQPFSGMAFAKSARLEHGESITTLFQGVGEVTRRE